MERLKREGAKSKADVILLVDAARINNAAEAGLLKAIQSKQLEKSVPSLYRDPKGRWFGLTRRVRAIIVNPKIVNPSKIKSYADLLALNSRKTVFENGKCLQPIAYCRSDHFERRIVCKAWVMMVKNVTQPHSSGDTSLIRSIGQKCGIESSIIITWQE